MPLCLNQPAWIQASATKTPGYSVGGIIIPGLHLKAPSPAVLVRARLEKRVCPVGGSAVPLERGPDILIGGTFGAGEISRAAQSASPWVTEDGLPALGRDALLGPRHGSERPGPGTTHLKGHRC